LNSLELRYRAILQGDIFRGWGDHPMRREMKFTDSFWLTEDTQSLHYEDYLVTVFREITSFYFKNLIDGSID